MDNTNISKGRLEETIFAICSEWLSLVEIDLVGDSYITLHNNMEDSGLHFPKTGCYSELNKQVQELVALDYQKSRKQFGGLEKLRICLTDKSRIECEYVLSVGSDNWRRDIFQVIERDDEKPVRIVWVHVNIEQKKTDELKQRQLVQEATLLSEQAYAIKNMYLNRISKELKTPMNVIIGNTAIARSFSTDSDRVEECLENISKSARSMFQMIQQLEKMDAIEEGNLVMQMQDVSIIEVWATALDMLRPTLQKHKHKINTENVSVTHSHVRGDASMMRQIIMNLLQNAISYTPIGGQIIVSVKETQIDESYGLYQLSVEDNGVGMTDEFRKILFEPFAREHSLQVGHVQGLGLGLAIVQNLVRIMNGEILVDSVCGRGTKVTVSIKFAYVDEHAGYADKKVSENQTIYSDYAGKRVLLVDDNELIAGVERKMLETIGMVVEYALNGEDAVRMFEDAPEGYYDLVVMDLGLPGIDGYVATMGIRQLNRKDGEKIPVIEMTGSKNVERFNMANQDNIYHISKPFDAHELMQVLRKIF